MNTPIRPIPLKWRDKPIALITHFEDDIEGWAGIVFSIQNGQRLMYMPYRPDGLPLVEEAQYLNIAPMDYIETATRLKHSPKKGPNFVGLYSDIRHAWDDLISPEDLAWLKYCLDPSKKENAPVQKNTLD